MLAQKILRSFRRRLATASFLGGFADATALLLVLGAVALLAWRLCGQSLRDTGLTELRWWWSCTLLVPVAFGCWRMWRAAWPANLQAAHVDQRLGLGGLLLSGEETADRSWRAEVDARVQASVGRLPGLRWGALGARILVPAGLFAATCLLPEVSAISKPTNRPIAQALADLHAELELEKQADVLPEDKLAELTARAKELEQSLSAGKEVTWGDVDALEARLAHEKLAQQDALQKTAEALRALQEARRNPGAQSPSAKAAEMESRMQELLEHAAAAGLLGKLPPELDPSRAAHAADAEAFDKLAEALAETALEQVEAMRAEPGELDDLAELLEELEAGEGDGMTQGVGRGGVDRGPGHATLELNENFGGDTSALEAKKLPPGRVLPQDWEVMQTSRTDPEVAPTRNQGAGSGAAQGTGEAAWRRRLAPRHREVVHEFFSGRAAQSPPGENKEKR